MQPKKAGGLGPLKFPLLADVSKSISKSFGVLIENEADPDFGVALRATAIVDPKGILRSLSVNDLPVGRNPDEVLRQVQVRVLLSGSALTERAPRICCRCSQGFKFTDETGGQVCPAGWRPGKKTMANKPKESKEYFASAVSKGVCPERLVTRDSSTLLLPCRSTLARAPPVALPVELHKH